MEVRVKDHPDLVKDSNSGAVINSNATAYQKAVAAHQRALEEKQKLDSAVDDINNLKTEITEVKGLLQEILKRV